MTVNLAICQFSLRWLVLARAGPRWLALARAGSGWLGLAWAGSKAGSNWPYVGSRWLYGHGALDAREWYSKFEISSTAAHREGA